MVMKDNRPWRDRGIILNTALAKERAGWRRLGYQTRIEHVIVNGRGNQLSRLFIRPR